MSSIFIYVVDRDFGFAPNPFHGSCTLATCKPGIRNSAFAGDWVFGMGGSRLHATGKCIFAMRVSKKLTFCQYWTAPDFKDKKPVRNGSLKMMVGDNIYFRPSADDPWQQADSHHSNADGTPNAHNVNSDTSADAVLVSDHFYYFGSSAPLVNDSILSEMGYKNRRQYRRFDLIGPGAKLVAWLEAHHSSALNRVRGDPFDFDNGAARYEGRSDTLSE